MKSAIYEGVVDHVRFRPVRHSISMRLAMTYLDLDELDMLFDDDGRFANERAAIATFDRRDHICAGTPSLAEAARLMVENRLGTKPDGAVRLLTHLRYLGYGFNPVSFFYCFDLDERLVAIVSEVNNTPWGERHCYVHDARRERLGASSPDALTFTFDKAFHVSPFMRLDQRYSWRFTEPGESLAVVMTSADARPSGDGRPGGEAPLFRASMRLSRLPWTRESRSRLLMRYPAITAQVVLGIYAHAAILRWKGIPYVPHPDDPDRESPPLVGALS
jgi:uncharacterized protein